MRKRYLRRSTCIAGHGTPFTRMTSPNSPEWSRSSKISDPSLANIASLMMSGTS